MKVLIYKNEKNKENLTLIAQLENCLEENGIEFETLFDGDLNSKISADALYVFGGDGTILRLVNFAVNNDIPIIGVNTGNLGFLTEFEKDKFLHSVEMLKNNDYKIDSRALIQVNFKNKTYLALNDTVLQRRYLENYSNLVIEIAVNIDSNFVNNIKGDGVLVSTPTGSTAYSLSSGGSILSPNINANSLTPICAHSLNSRPIVYSSSGCCKLELISGSLASLFIDGKFVDIVNVGEYIEVVKCDKAIKFIRKKDSNFYKILFSKLSKGN